MSLFLLARYGKIKSFVLGLNVFVAATRICWHVSGFTLRCFSLCFDAGMDGDIADALHSFRFVGTLLDGQQPKIGVYLRLEYL
jgi:hypothetical protein